MASQAASRAHDWLTNEEEFTNYTSDDVDALLVDVKETYDYDSNGHLIKVTRPYDFSEDMTIESYSFIWKDGNIVKVTCAYNDEVGEERIINYTSYTNNIPPYFTETMGVNVFLFWQGYYGKKCRNLPASETINLPFISQMFESSYTFHYDYAIKNGVIEKITKHWTYKEVPSTLAYELEWY